MITWKWKGDIYSIEAFEIGITGVGNKPTPNSILKSEFVIINNENDVAEILDDGTMVFKCNGYNICEEYDVWIRPLFYKKNGKWVNLKNGNKFENIFKEEPVFNKSEKKWKNTFYDFSKTVINNNTIATGSITCDKVLGNTATIGGLNDSNGIIKIYDNNEIEELVLINNNGILINGKNLIIRDKYNRTIIDNENIYASKIISENILINNKNLIVKSYDGIEEKNVILMNNNGLTVFNINDNDIVNINKNGILIKSGYLNLENYTSTTIIDNEGINVGNIYVNNLIINKQTNNNDINLEGICIKNHYLLDDIVLNDEGITIYEYSNYEYDDNNNLINYTQKEKVKINKDGLTIYGDNNITLFSANKIDASFITSGQITLNPSGKIVIYNKEDNGNIYDFLTFNSDGIVFKDKDKNPKIIINKNNIEIVENFWKIKTANGRFIGFDNGEVKLDILCGINNNSGIILFKDAMLIKRNNSIQLKYKNNKVTISKHKFCVYLNIFQNGSFPILKITNNSIFWCGYEII